MAVLVSATLTLGPAPARSPVPFTELEAHVQVLAGQKKYRDLAVVGATGFERRDLEPYQRRMMAFFAIRGLHGVYEETGHVSSLCDAGRLMRRVQTEVGFAEDADAAARLKKATEKHLASTGVDQPCPRRKPVRSSPPVAARPASPAKVDDRSVALEVQQPRTNVDDDLLAETATSRPEDAPRDMSHGPASQAQRGPAPRVLDRADPDEARSAKLAQAGFALLALGAAGSVGFGLTVHYRERASDTIDVLRATADKRGESTPEEYARAHAYNEAYQRLTVAAGVSSALAIAGVVGAVTLFSLRARRGSTLAGPWVGPAGAGLQLRGRF